VIREFLGGKLPQYMIPNDFVEVKEFPLTANGKVDRKSLPSPRQSKKSTAEKMETNYVIEKLAPIFARVLGVDTVDARENFFAMGGDSVTGIRIINEAAKEGIEITPQQLFEKQNIYDLAEVLNVAIPIEESLETMARQKGAVALAPYQHWFFKRHQHSLKYMNLTVQMKTRDAVKPELMESAFRHLVQFHDALQLRYVKKNNVWEQEYDELAGLAQLDVVDVTGLSAEDFEATVGDIRGQLEDMQDLSASPLLKLCLFQDRKNQVSHLLLIVHQLVMDYRSIPLFFEDLDAAYRQLATGNRVKARRQSKFKAWVDQCVEKLELEEVRESVRQLQESLPVEPPALRLRPPATKKNYGVGYIVQIDESTTRVLFDETLATYKTNPEEFLLIALAFTFTKGGVADSLYLDWMVHSEGKYKEGHGFGETLGVLGWVSPLHFELGTGNDVEENIRNIKDKLRIAYSGENRELLYSLGDPSSSAVPEIFFDYRANVQSESFFETQWATTTSGRNYRGGSYALEIRAEINDGRLQVNWIFDNTRFAHESIMELAHKFVDEVNLLIENRDACQQTVLSASDFPDADVDQAELEKLLTLLN
jgi:non-ribosomal peptide synthase protein (TIGR01720 family)